MPYRTKAEIVTVRPYLHGFFMRLKRRIQKYFMRKQDDQKFAARFNRAVRYAYDKHMYILAEKACDTWEERDRRIAYGFAEDTPALKFKTRWILRSALRRMQIMNQVFRG